MFITPPTAQSWSSTAAVQHSAVAVLRRNKKEIGSEILTRDEKLQG
ncbi:hypothetical protein OROMI_023042 [Orobanche minor]